jgi:acetyl-CoA carboxylase carboxyl transferase subunit alpha
MLVLEFERPIVELNDRIEALRQLQEHDGVDLSESIRELVEQSERLHAEIFSGLTAWQRTLLSRHPARPYTLDYIESIFEDWEELKGDRLGFEDSALVCGFARFRGQPVVVMGHQKGRNTKENLYRNFGMARPEGYRKALRIMKLAEKYNRPIITFIDTPGAYPGLDAEARGQAEAIARNIMKMAGLTVPVICVVIGEGGSGGALAVGVGNRVLMMSNSVYSVISPEGCAAILWRDRAEGPTAAEALKITGNDCLSLGVADEVIAEPASGAHRDPAGAAEQLGNAIARHLAELSTLSPQELEADRYDRFRKLGRFLDPASEA